MRVRSTVTVASVVTAGQRRLCGIGSRRRRRPGAVLDRAVEILVRVAERDKSRPAAAAGTPAPGSSPTDPEVARLSAELVNAPAAGREEVLTKLRDGKGSQYTDALAHAIHKLDGPTREKAREALADRLTRYTSKTLTDKLQDDDSEVRRAAALAVAMKDDRANVPRVIELLGDRDTVVSVAAHAALKQMSGRDLGSGASAIPEWKKWWSENEGRRIPGRWRRHALRGTSWHSRSRNADVAQPAGPAVYRLGRGGVAAAGRPVPAPHPPLAGTRPGPESRRGGRSAGGDERPGARAAPLPASADGVVPAVGARDHQPPLAGTLPPSPPPAPGRRRIPRRAVRPAQRAEPAVGRGARSARPDPAAGADRAAVRASGG